MEDFRSLDLPEAVLHSLEVMKFTTPTPIQKETIPPALQGRDVLGTAQTGTGKTAAYSIPLVVYLLNNPNKAALVLTPTRELAIQVLDTLTQLLGRKSGIRTTLLIGGRPMSLQFKQLQNRPQLIVGTPGRVNDHLSRNSLKLDNAEFLVLDETDRMLDMGFSIQIENIVSCLPQKRQTLMFSATMAKDIVKTANSYLNDAVRISIGSTTSPIEKIKQESIHTTEPKKYSALLEQLDQFQGSFIIFVKTKAGTERLAGKLCDNGHSADVIHGDLRQRDRERAIKAFRDGRNRVLVATDVAARGLDVPDVEVVVNYDLPQDPDDYIHRIGRTGRAGAEGKAINLITPQDGGKWKDICRMLNPNDKTDYRSQVRSNSGGGRRKNTRGSSGFGASFEKGGQRSGNNYFSGGASGRPSFGKPRFTQNGPSRRSDSGYAFEKGGQRSGNGYASNGPSDRPAFGKPRFAQSGAFKRSDAGFGASFDKGGQRSGNGYASNGPSDRPSFGKPRFTQNGPSRRSDSGYAFEKGGQRSGNSYASNGPSDRPAFGKPRFAQNGPSRRSDMGFAAASYRNEKQSAFASRQKPKFDRYSNSPHSPNAYKPNKTGNKTLRFTYKEKEKLTD
jgi:ATP-dependent RNA helicase DeaD